MSPLNKLVCSFGNSQQSSIFACPCSKKSFLFLKRNKNKSLQNYKWYDYNRKKIQWKRVTEKKKNKIWLLFSMKKVHTVSVLCLLLPSTSNWELIEEGVLIYSSIFRRGLPITSSSFHCHKVRRGHTSMKAALSSLLTKSPWC